MTSHQAADRMGVSVRHVQRLAADGELVVIGPDRIDADSVAQWIAQRSGRRTRAWEEPTAWAAIAVLEGLDASWLGQAQRSRLRAAITAATATELAARTRNRASVQRYHVHPRALGHLRDELVASGLTEGVAGLGAARDRLDGYVDRASLDRLQRRYRLEVDPAGTVSLRATGMPLDVVEELATGRRHVLAGLDLAGSTDPRERAAGQRLLDRALDALRG